MYEAREYGKGWFAVIDESGGEYAYPPGLFEIVASSPKKTRLPAGLYKG